MRRCSKACFLLEQVKFATNVETGLHYAVKMIDKSRMEEAKMVAQIKREIAVMKLVRHPNVVNLIEACAPDPRARAARTRGGPGSRPSRLRLRTLAPGDGQQDVHLHRA